MAEILAWLLAPLALPFGLTSSWAEVLGFGAGVVTVGLAAANSWWTWPTGVANNAIWIALFLGNGLYADALLQAIYIGQGVYGTWHWLRGGPRRDDDLPVTRTPGREARLVAALVIAGTAIGAWLLATRTNSTVPLLDAATTVASLAANWLLARKRIENWPVWILAVNIPYIGLYLLKGLALTAALQLVFIALSLAGWRRWARQMGTEPGVPARAPAAA